MDEVKGNLPMYHMSIFKAGSNMEIRRIHLRIFGFIPAWTTWRGQTSLVYERYVERVKSWEDLFLYTTGIAHLAGLLANTAVRGKSHLDERQKENNAGNKLRNTSSMPSRMS